MARVGRKRKPQAAPKTPLELLLHEHLAALSVRGFTENTIEGRRVHLGFFTEWAYQHGLQEPIEITRPVLERYQRYLFFYRKKNGEPLTFHSQHARLMPLRGWFKWMTRQNYILHNPASEIELPRLGRSLPKNLLSAAEVERIMALCEIEEPIGLRDRAMLEVFYSTGMRRMEIATLKLYDLEFERGLIFVRQGKGKKDRYVPIGERATAWLRKYIREARPELAIEPDDMTVFLTAQGESITRDHLTYVVRERIGAAKLGKTGSCHLFRHTMATLMHENGADIRLIQQLLGHADLSTTQIYTQVSIRALQQAHAATHPAAFLDPKIAPKIDAKKAPGNAPPLTAAEDFQPGNPAAEELAEALARDAQEDCEEAE